ncbi:hypothetical protein P9139_13865 [Curtobacterium flaccumfaciens]|nr:hypothetical protein P9139_13865 [Curtobacterium flaccumfaciens]
MTARVGAGERPDAAVRRVAASTPDWSHAVVLHAGRVSGLVTRADLEQPVRRA